MVYHCETPSVITFVYHSTRPSTKLVFWHVILWLPFGYIPRYQCYHTLQQTTLPNRSLHTRPMRVYRSLFHITGDSPSVSDHPLVFSMLKNIPPCALVSCSVCLCFLFSAIRVQDPSVSEGESGLLVSSKIFIVPVAQVPVDVRQSRICNFCHARQKKIRFVEPIRSRHPPAILRVERFRLYFAKHRQFVLHYFPA